MQLQYKAADSWTDCFKITPDKGVPIKMPNTAYLGFSAHTGELSDNFDIVSVETRNLYNPVASQSGRSAPGSKAGGGPARSTKQQSGGWSWFLLKVVLFFLVIGGAYVGYTAYRSRQNKNRYGVL